jgi:hypothetical protein
VVKRALERYYEQAGTPRHERKGPARLTGYPQEQAAKLAGYPTGQIGPQDVSLSEEQDYAEDSPSSFGEADEAPYEASNDDWEELQELDNEEFTREVEDQSRMLSSSKESVQSTLNTELTIPTLSPNSAPPPSPPLPKAAPEFIRIGAAIFKMPEPGGIMIPHRGKLPPGAIVHDKGGAGAR